MQLLSCDNPQDATRSLALIYQVSESKILEIVNGKWPDWITNAQESYHDLFHPVYTPHLMGDALKSKPSFDLGEIAYYHRTSYDGNPEWFKAGLLASIQGASAYLDKVRILIPDFDRVEKLAHANIKDRTDCEGRDGGGPYAFDVFDDGKGASRSGLDYGAPEFLCGRFWIDRNDGVEAAIDLYEELVKNLKPVVVKFKATTERQETYITNLWYYLFRVWEGAPMTGCDHYPCTFSGRGISVHPEKILQIIEL